MPITQVLLTATASAAPPPPPPPTPDGTFFYNGSPLAWGSVGINGNKPVYDANYAFPDGQTTGQSWGFNGNDNLMTTPTSAGFTQIYMNIWFYPYANGRILMTIQDTLAESQAYHHSALEINANNTVSGRFWANGYITTANTVTLNAWNHIYFRHNGTQALLQLNGGTAVTQNGVWSYPTPLVVGFGTTSLTNNGYSARYNGMLAEFRLNSTNTASNYDSTRSKYEAPQPFIYDDFTIEWWQKAEAIGVNSRPWAIGLLGSASGQVVSISYEGNGRDYFWINGSFPAQLQYRPLKNHYTSTWEHMAIVRKDNTVKLYSNGSEYMSWPYANQAITALNANLVVGTGEIPNGNFQGWIKDLHIIKGYAKYNANFSVPTQPIQPQTGSVFLLPAMGAGGAFDDTVGNKFGSYTNTPTYSTLNPYGGWPEQTFTAFAYGTNRIALSTGLALAEPRIGLLVSDTQGWSDYVIDIPIANHLDFAGSVPVRAPGEVYTIREVALTGTATTHGGGGQIVFDQSNYSKRLAGVQVGWAVSADGGATTLGQVTSVTESPAPSVQILINFNPLPYLVNDVATWTFTPPNYGGSIRFDAGDRIDYGSSVDFAFDVDGIEGGFLNMNIDANNYYSYNSSNSDVWYDLTGNAANVTLYNSPYWDNGPPGNFNFNGVNQYAVGSTASMLPQSGYTKMVWFKLNTINADNNIVSSNLGGHYMYFAGGNRMWTGHSNVQPYNGPGAFGSTSTFSVDTWYCVTVTFSVANGIKLYINGVLDNSDPAFQTPHNGNGSVNLGCFAPAGNLLNGKIGRVLCYGAELTAGQVLQNFNATRNRYGI